MEKESLPLPLREKLIAAAAIDYPTASEIVVSFPDRWELVGCFRRQGGFCENTRLYVAVFPQVKNVSQPNHFIGLSPEINRSLTSYRLYKLFEPWPQPILPIAWDESRGAGRVLARDRPGVQLQPIGQTPGLVRKNVRGSLGVFRAQPHCVVDDTVSWWELTSSLRRSQKPSPLIVVSFWRTARAVRAMPTLKTQTCRTGQEGLVDHWRRRDMIPRNIVNGRKMVLKIMTTTEETFCGSG